MIKVVSFDIGGTLLISDENISEDKYNLKQLAKTDIFQKQKGSFDELVSCFCNNLNIKPSENLSEFFRKKFEVSVKMHVNEQAVDTIRTLKEMGFKVIYFSNSNCLITNTLDKGLYDLADDIFYSYDIGFTKNDAESYKIVEYKEKCNPNEFLHIGDTLKSDYYCPLQNGWNALYYGTTSISDVKSIKKLDEVLDYLNVKVKRKKL